MISQTQNMYKPDDRVKVYILCFASKTLNLLIFLLYAHYDMLRGQIIIWDVHGSKMLQLTL